MTLKELKEIINNPIWDIYDNQDVYIGDLRGMECEIYDVINKKDNIIIRTDNDIVYDN